MSTADHTPLTGDLRQTPQPELPEAASLFDLAEHGFDYLFSQPIATPIPGSSQADLHRVNLRPHLRLARARVWGSADSFDAFGPRAVRSVVDPRDFEAVRPRGCATPRPAIETRWTRWPRAQGPIRAAQNGARWYFIPCSIAKAR